MVVDIKRDNKVPVYQQIVDSIEAKIEKGEISQNDQIPSINQIANQNKIARDTVVKAFKLLQERGIINSVRGKGFFVSSNCIQMRHRVFLMLDALTPYKQSLYESIKNTFGKTAFIDVYFHHYNCDVFQKLIQEAEGNYSSYILLPFEGKRVSDIVGILPSNKVFVIDQKPKTLKGEYFGVYQDFINDLHASLSELQKRIANYNKLTLVFRNTATQVPTALKEGFVNYCTETGVNYDVRSSINTYKLQKGESFLVIDDDDLVYLVEYCSSNNLKIGKDIGILSYNETALKRVVAGGITVISTDWEFMGAAAAQMILDGKPDLIANPCKVINRNSF